jgi:predicted RecB family nuclease
MATRLDVSVVPMQGGYIAKRCPVVAHHANDPTLDVKLIPVSPATQLRFDRGNTFEAEMFSELTVLHSDAVVVDRDLDRSGREEATVNGMEAGVPLVVGGRLPADEVGRRVGEPDILVREGRGPEGQWAYVPVDIKHHLTLRDTPESTATVSSLADLVERVEVGDQAVRLNEGDVLQLAHYHRMLEAAGHAPVAPWGGIVGKEQRAVWYDLNAALWLSGGKRRTALERYDFEFGFRLDVAATARRRGGDPSVEPLVVPVRIDQCDECEWWGVCGPILEETDDVSLLPRIGWPQWRDLRAGGVATQADLARLDWLTARLIDQGVDVGTYLEAGSRVDPSTSVAEVIGVRRTRQTAVLTDAGFNTAADASRLDRATIDVAFGRGPTPIPTLSSQIDTARARLGRAPAYRRRDIEALIVPRADVEVDVDMENSVNNQAYLWGALVTETGTDPVYHPFVTWEPLDPEGVRRREVFLGFWEWLTELVDSTERDGRTAVVYCYSRQAEAAQMRGALGEDDAQVRDAVEEFMASPRWVDMYRVFDTHLVTGDRIGLKKVAALAGFSWRDDDPDGALSMVWYEHAAAGDPEAQSRLLAYNEDDVRATRALREWMSRTAFPSIADWRESDLGALG